MRDSRAPWPTSMVTVPGSLSSDAACCTTSGAGMLRGRWSTNFGTAVSFGRSSPPTSPGSVSTATPCSCSAALPACSIRNGSWSMLVTVAVEHRDVGEEPVVVDLLEELAADLLARHLAADGQDRGVRLLGVVQPVEEVDRARPDGAHADAEATGQLCLRARGEGARLLVPHADPLDPVLAPDGVGDRVERVSDHAPDAGDAVLGQGLDQQLGDGGHGRSSGWWVGIRG